MSRDTKPFDHTDHEFDICPDCSLWTYCTEDLCMLCINDMCFVEELT